MTVRIGKRTLNSVDPASDRDTLEAVQNARALKQAGFEFTTALVHRFDGLVLLEVSEESNPNGHHFRTPLCGYEGTGPRATVEILEMFGFGNEITLYDEVLKKPSCKFTR